MVVWPIFLCLSSWFSLSFRVAVGNQSNHRHRPKSWCLLSTPSAHLFLANPRSFLSPLPKAHSVTFSVVIILQKPSRAVTDRIHYRNPRQSENQMLNYTQFGDDLRIKARAFIAPMDRASSQYLLSATPCSAFPADSAIAPPSSFSIGTIWMVIMALKTRQNLYLKN